MSDLSTNAPTAKSRQTALPGGLGFMYERRWLIWYFVQRQLTQTYKGSYLGIVWAFLTPLLMIILYTIVFSEILDLRFREVESNPNLNFGLYLYCGLIPFMVYAETVNQCVGLVKSNAQLVQRVVFPVEVLPLTSALANFLSHLFGLGVLILVVAALNRTVEWTLVLLPVLMVLQLLFVVGLGYLVAVIGAYLPDVKETLRAIVRASFFITPIIWPVSKVADKEVLSLVVELNPLAFLVEGYRNLVLDGEIPGIKPTLYFALFAGALFAVGFVLFNRTKKQFADLI